jgi:hypothetical protein
LTFGVSAFKIGSMREWHLKAGDPLSLTLSADARMGPTDYFNDQIWEISLNGGEPPALAIQTTYGLRANNLRLFPRFYEGDLDRCDPTTFTSPPAVRRFFPNFTEITFSPFENIEVTAEYWAITSQSNVGRLTIVNTGSSQRQIRLEWVAILAPSSEGQRMSIGRIQDTSVLVGQSGGLEPVVLLSGGAQAGIGPYPSMFLDLEILPGKSQMATWSQAALASAEGSFFLARQAGGNSVGRRTRPVRAYQCWTG